jgi:hypothetical protein
MEMLAFAWDYRLCPPGADVVVDRSPSLNGTKGIILGSLNSPLDRSIQPEIVTRIEKGIYTRGAERKGCQPPKMDAKLTGDDPELTYGPTL